LPKLAPICQDLRKHRAHAGWEEIMKTLSATAALAAGLATVAQPAAAKVVKFEVVRIESPAFEGRSFGTVGTYDRIVARATIAVAPSDPHNSVIVDIGRAPRNAQGLVEATTDVEILRPTVAANGNRRLIYDVVNRGSKRALAMFNDSSAGNDIAKAADAGSGFLMNRGYTVVWSGWQGDLGAGGSRVTLSVPTVPEVSGLAREEFIFDHSDNPATATLSYPAADLDPAHAKLFVRQREGDPRATPAGLSFKFDSPTKITLTRPVGFDGGAIYELVYQAKNPKVMGLGLATTRDLVSFLRHEAADASGTANVLAGRIDRAIGFGQSQSGRYLHDFLYYGFNDDEAGRAVFEGLMPHLAGGKKTFTNFRFSQPGRSAYQHADTLYPGAEFPFTYPVTTDALTGKTDGMLARCLAANNCPRIVKTDTELEFYQGRAGLVPIDTKGNPLTMPDNVRLFLLANLQHAAPPNAKSALTRTCSYPSNPLYAGTSLRALLVALDQWITDGTQPPASRYPSRADGTLAEPNAAAVGFPAIPGVSYPAHINQAAVVDVTAMPPVRGAAYPAFVPKTDADGRDLAGLKLPTLEAPIATHTGWNLRKAGFGDGELCDNTGSMLPFAKTREERMAKGDLRLSLAERYPQPGDRAALIERAARKLVADRLLLEEDVPGFLQPTN
jgi:Alpha/beta hydrolase domain